MTLERVCGSATETITNGVVMIILEVKKKHANSKQFLLLSFVFMYPKRAKCYLDYTSRSDASALFARLFLNRSTQSNHVRPEEGKHLLCLLFHIQANRPYTRVRPPAGSRLRGRVSGVSVSSDGKIRHYHYYRITQF